MSSTVANYGRLLLAFVIFVQAGRLALGEITCINNGNYATNSSYVVNLNTSVQLLHENVDNYGFYNASAGQGADRVNAVVLCRGDGQLNECKDCILEAKGELLRSCPLAKQAIRWDNHCMLRYSNATIYGVLQSDIMWFLRNPNNATSPEEFQVDLRGLLEGLRDQAASGGSLRKVAAANVTGPDFQTIFALVQCTPDLSQDECTRCLINTYNNINVGCEGKTGCRILGPNCILQFETSPFYNETRLRELEAVAASPPVPAPVGDPPSQSSAKDDGNTTLVVIIIVVPIALVLILAVSAIMWLRKRRSQKPTENHLENDDEISTAESLQYAFSTIKTATNDFSDDNKLGQGGFGAVYKGKLVSGKEIAVKRLSRDSGQGDLEFKNEVLLLAKLQHRNLVRLLGFSIQGMEKLLIYELVQNASLDHFIFDQENRSHLDWDRRYKIIGGIARGILYLHEDSRLRIIHRDLKASNILLDGKMNPKIADFGMARLFGQDETQANTNRVVGTYGYMPPEYIINGQFSIKSDVFSFGVLVLEIISGRKNNNFRRGENIEDLLSFAWKNWHEGSAANVVDPMLMRSGSGSMNEMLRCIHIGLLCVQENAAERPTMAPVVIMLSSSSISLAMPSQPAFYVSDVSRLDHHDYTETQPIHNLQKPNDHSDHSSHNDVSITKFYHNDRHIIYDN